MASIADVDDLLRVQSILWSALHNHGRERRLEAQHLAEIDDLLDARLDIMKRDVNEQRQALPQ